MLVVLSLHECLGSKSSHFFFLFTGGTADTIIDDCLVPVKHPKGPLALCIICGHETQMSTLAQPKDVKSWKTLCDATNIRLFNPILKLKKDNPSSIPNVFLSS